MQQNTKTIPRNEKKSPCTSSDVLLYAESVCEKQKEGPWLDSRKKLLFL